MSLWSLVERHHRAFNDRDFDAWEEVFDENIDLVVDGAAFQGVEAAKAYGAGATREFPLLRIGEARVVAETADTIVPGQLDADGIRGLAREITGKLREVCDHGADKHLLLAGPVALAVLVGAANNGNGTLTMPLWNGSAYVSPIIIGGTYAR